MKTKRRSNKKRQVQKRARRQRSKSKSSLAIVPVAPPVVDYLRKEALAAPSIQQTVQKHKEIRFFIKKQLKAGIDYDNIPAADTSEFNLTVQRVRTPGTEQVEDQEIFPRVSVLPDAERYVGHAFSESELVRLDGGVPSQRPDRTLDRTSGLATGYIVSNAHGLTNVPTIFLVDTGGTVKVSSMGFDKKDLEAIAAELAQRRNIILAPLFRPEEVVPINKPG